MSERKVSKGSKESIKLDQLTPGVKYLTEGYLDYAKSVLVARGVADLRDGLKPVSRRLMVVAKDNFGYFGKEKSTTLVGASMKLHPHGDSSIYEKLVLMTDKHQTMQLPVFGCQGAWGSRSTGAKPAKERYTECWLNDNAKDYFGEMAGVETRPNFDATAVEPVVLPVSYPAVLCNESSGIVVGFRSSVPSFNFNDVIDLTIEYIEQGSCTSVIAPDFTTGGEYILDKAELQKLMEVGVASLKLRGKVEVRGKEIAILEVPYGSTTTSIANEVQRLDTLAIKESGETSDVNGGSVTILCTSKDRVEEVLYLLYKKTGVQTSYSASMLLINDGAPKFMGVWGVISEWVTWRRSVLERDMKSKLNTLNSDLKQVNAMMAVVKWGKKDQLVDILYREGKQAGYKFLMMHEKELGINSELAEWLTRRTVLEFHNGDLYSKKYREGKKLKKVYEKYLKDIDILLLEQLRDLKKTKGPMYPRRTIVTTKDYVLKGKEKELGKVERDKTVCTFILTKDGFIQKIKGEVADTDNVLYSVTGVGSDTVVLLDTFGQILRIYGDDLKYNTKGKDMGEYLAKYLGLSDIDLGEITYMTLLESKEVMLLYRDGNIGFINMDEWIGVGRNIKVIAHGICTDLAKDIVGIYERPKGILVVKDSKGYIGGVVVDTIIRKNRKAKTRCFTLRKGVVLEDGKLREGIDSYYIGNRLVKPKA